MLVISDTPRTMQHFFQHNSHTPVFTVARMGSLSMFDGKGDRCGRDTRHLSCHEPYDVQLYGIRQQPFDQAPLPDNARHITNCL